MSQPTHIIEYLGAIIVEPRKQYTSASVLTKYPTANVMKMKTSGIKAGVDGSDMFTVSYDDESYIATGRTFIFSDACTIVIGRYVNIT